VSETRADLSIHETEESVRETRFEFGDNWRRFLDVLTEGHIQAAEASLRETLAVDSLVGRSFLDVGSGSGIHSLAALRLGASSIFSFDYDAASVACTQELRRRAGEPAHWTVRQGSVLDLSFMQKEVPAADEVYSWGVLHHTGAMWDAIRNTAEKCTAPGSRLLIGIYNKKRPATDLMKIVKRTYAASGPPLRRALLWSYWGVTSVVQLVRGRNPLAEVRGRRLERGMDYWRDLEDWVGGYPYECASPSEIQSFVAPLGLRLQRSRVRTTLAAVNEFLFERPRE
jgi:2-polyprenyl-6-hydroxyphenyl methylase/3-demethylubiquinone-9 3-methyltransferase